MSNGSPPSSGLSPDTGSLQQLMVTLFNANTAITSYATGLVNTVVQQLPEQGAWYATFSQNLQTAQTHANEWLTQVGPEAFAQVPQSIITYGTTFGLATSDVLNIVNASPPQAVLTQAEVTEIQELMGALQDQLEAVVGTGSPPSATSIRGVAAALDTFLTNIESDGVNLTSAQNGAQAELQIDETTQATITSDIAQLTKAVQKLDTDLIISEVSAGVGFFAMVAGLLLAPVTGGASLVVAFAGFAVAGGAAVSTAVYDDEYDQAQQQLQSDQAQLSAEQAQVTALQGILQGITTLSSQNQAAQQALEQIIDAWETLSSKMADVVSDVKAADGGTIIPILEELDIQEAQAAWQQLVTFATALQECSITPSTILPPAGSPPVGSPPA